MLIVKAKKAGAYWLHGTRRITIAKGDEFTGADAQDLIAAGFASEPRAPKAPEVPKAPTAAKAPEAQK